MDSNPPAAASGLFPLRCASLGIALVAVAFFLPGVSKAVQPGDQTTLVLLEPAILRVGSLATVRVQLVDPDLCEGRGGLAQFALLRPLYRVNIVWLQCEGTPDTQRYRGTILGEDRKIGVIGECADAACDSRTVFAQKSLTFAISSIARESPLQ